MTDDYSTTDDAPKAKRPSRAVWLARVEAEKKAHKDWREQAREAERAYLGKPSDQGKPAPIFPIFWATVQVTHAAIFARMPKPDVRKRYADTAQNRLAQCIERCLSYTIDTTDFAAHGHRLVDDFLIAGMGVAKVEMDAEMGEAPVTNPETGQPILGDDGQPLTQQIITRQGLRLRHFPWSRFRWEPGKDWEHCDWVSFVHCMTGAEIKARFGVEVKKAGAAESDKPSERYAKSYDVEEIWDRKTRQVLFLSDCHEDWLQIGPFPFTLQGSYPCPKPAFLGLKSDELEPTPDYLQIKHQCEEVNHLAGRIKAITKSIRDVGFYDAQLQELATLQGAPDGTRVPLKNLAERLSIAGTAGFGAVLAEQDNTGKIEVLRELLALLAAAKQQIYEILGIADIVRGATEADETATAQQIKGQWANVRIGPKMQALAMFYRDVFRIMAEIIGEHFQPDQIAAMSGIELQPEELKQLKSDIGRTFAIDVETDSTVAADEYEERAQWGELMQAVTQMGQHWGPLMQQGVLPADLFNVMLKGTVARFKHGRELEDTIATLPNTVQQLQQQQQTIQQGAQQIEQLTMQLQQMQAMLQKVNERDELRKDIQTQADVQVKAATAQGKQAEAVKDVATARKFQAEATNVVPLPV